MAAGRDSLQDELDQLYAQPPANFVSARDSLAKKLRNEGDRDGAQLVKGLRKPSPAAWALNQLRVRDGVQVAELLDAGARMREAQQELISSGEREPLRAAAAKERELVEELAGAAEQELTAARHTVSAALRSQLFDTLHAAAGDAEAREQLRTGRLHRDHRLSDLGLAQAPPAGAGGTREARTERREARTERREADRHAKALELELGQARARQSQAQRFADEAGRLAAEAQREAERAAEDATRARGLAAAAADRVSELEGALGELQLR